MSLGHSIGIIVQAVDRFSAPMRRINERIERFSEPVRRLGLSFAGLGRVSGLSKLAAGIQDVGSKLKNAVGAAGALAGKLALLGGTAIFAFKQGFVDVAGKFEDFKAVLTTLEGGDVGKAEKDFAWISEFAAKTPYELDTVTDAFVKLKSYGLDPMDGLATSTGDAAAAMGKDYMQAVEAIADAVTGENERLKEFGIKASKVGSKIVYEYTKDGKTMHKAVDANNKHLIQKTIESIWNSKYAGAMDARSKTWNGMLSNLSDWWTRFANMVMQSGAFEWLKDKLGGFLAMLQQMADSGELQQLANDIGVKLVEGLKMAWEAGKELGTALMDLLAFLPKLASFMGGWGNVAMLAAAVVAGPLLMAIASLTASFVTLGVAIGFTPIGWFLGIVAAIAALAYVVISNWDAISGFFTGLWEGVKGAFNGVLAFLQGFSLSAIGARIAASLGEGLAAQWQVVSAWFRDAVAGLLDLVPDGLKARLGLGGAPAATGAAAVTPTKTGAAAVMAGGAASPAAAGEQTVRTEVVIKGENLPAGMAVSAPRSQADRTSMDLGYSMAGP